MLIALPSITKTDSNGHIIKAIRVHFETFLFLTSIQPDRGWLIFLPELRPRSKGKRLINVTQFRVSG